jgi:hypothetical protein
MPSTVFGVDAPVNGAKVKKFAPQENALESVGFEKGYHAPRRCVI